MHHIGLGSGVLMKLVVVPLIWLLSVITAHAQPYEEPKERTIITITGKISSDIPDGIARIGYDTLEKMDVKDLKTRTFYSKNKYNFSGVLMRDLLDYVGAKGDMLEVTALDDYRITVPISDYYDYDVWLVFKLDGKRLSIRNRGPARIIYPIEQKPELNDKKIAGRYIWQIKGMKIK
ncbi:MAG: molybdopterin-dependent oxidoreductase [Cohaesibacter sp.]|nr:molybdopterin-dependent oxidoreductase [Cohaesibacter sp.]MCV6602034.1 molybdopterin-dependent oxidoreductase [Cohaesibacter sp.]